MSGLAEPEPPARRAAIVTGASSGIGRAIAEAFGALGWGVAVGARREDALRETERLVSAAGGTPFAHPLDVTDPASVEAFVTAASCALGPVDVLVNNAGIAHPGPLHELSDEDHRRILDTNLLGPLLITKRVVGALRAARRPGDVVFVASDVVVHPRPHMGTYTVSKAGLEALASVLAMECEGHRIRSTVVRVGPTLSAFGAGWDPQVFAELFPYWQRFGIQRHFEVMQPGDLARTVVAAVTAPSHMWVPLVEVQPQAPLT